jgi:hypothetical protein
MSKYIIRSQGFFFTDEYWAPTKLFRRISKTTYATKAEAVDAARTFARKWARSAAIGDFVFDDRAAVKAVEKYFRAHWPDVVIPEHRLYDLEIPDEATDEEVDELIALMKVTFAKVYEVTSRDKDIADRASEDLIYGPS